MAASKKWIRDAANLLEKKLGAYRAAHLINDLRAVPNANESVTQTLTELYYELDRRWTEAEHAD